MISYYIDPSTPALMSIIKAMTPPSVNLGITPKTEGEIKLNDMAPVIASSRSGSPGVFPMVWGYHIDGLDQPIGAARSESAPVKAVWKDGWNAHRCIVPASFYYEYEAYYPGDGRGKQDGEKYLVQPRDSDVTYLAGIYRREAQYHAFAVLTMESAMDVLCLQLRMPVILPRNAITAWIRPDGKPEEVLRMALRHMVKEKA